MKKSPLGRPTVFTDEVLQKLEQAFSLDCTDEEACVYADIAPSSLYNYQNSHPEFLERKKLLKQKLVLKARSVISKNLQENDRDTAKWYLERKRKDEFSTKQEYADVTDRPVINIDIPK